MRTQKPAPAPGGTEPAQRGAAIAAAAAPGVPACPRIGRPMTSRLAPARSASSGGGRPGLVVGRRPCRAHAGGDQRDVRADLRPDGSHFLRRAHQPACPGLDREHGEPPHGVRHRPQHADLVKSGPGSSEVSTVTAATLQAGWALDRGTDHLGATRRVHSEHVGAEPRATARAAPVTVADMSCSFRSRKILTPLCAADGGHHIRAVPEVQLEPDLDGADVWRDEPGPPRGGLQVRCVECDSDRRRLGQGSSSGTVTSRYRALAREPASRRGARLVCQSDHVHQALDCRLASSPSSSRRIRRQADGSWKIVVPMLTMASTGEDELQGVQAGAHPPHADDLHVRQRLPHLPDAPQRDVDRRAGQTAVGASTGPSSRCRS